MSQFSEANDECFYMNYGFLETSYCFTGDDSVDVFYNKLKVGEMSYTKSPIKLDGELVIMGNGASFVVVNDNPYQIIFNWEVKQSPND